MEVIELRSTVVRIFPVDEIDIRAITNPAFSSNFAKDFNFPPLQQPPLQGPTGVVFFQNGFLEIEGKKVIIDQITIDSRRIVVAVGGSSADARKVMDTVVSTAKAMETRGGTHSWEPLYQFDDAYCIARFKKQYQELMVDSGLSSIQAIIQKSEGLAPVGMKVSVFPISVKFQGCI